MKDEFIIKLINQRLTKLSETLILMSIIKLPEVTRGNSDLLATDQCISRLIFFQIYNSQ